MDKVQLIMQVAETVQPLMGGKMEVQVVELRAALAEQNVRWADLLEKKKRLEQMARLPCRAAACHAVVTR